MIKRKPRRLEDINDFDELLERAKFYRNQWIRAVNRNIERAKRERAIRAVLDGDVPIVTHGDDESVINLCNHCEHCEHNERN